ncbi:MAG: hypothetical protein HC813_00165, partial [Planctomycetes bacterium]|nr:hypothetical protein [Planctomycetota bacterium]
MASLLLLCLLTSGETRNLSLEKEVENYLAAGAAESGDSSTFRLYWKEGVRGETGDGNFRFHFGARVLADSHWRTSDDFMGGLTEDGVFFRDLRLELDGTMYKNVDFVVQVNFAKSSIVLNDVALALRGIPVVGTVRIGHFKEPFAFESLVSSKYTLFMEKSAAGNAFAPARNVGVALMDRAFEERLSWAIGLFRDTDDTGAGTDDGGYQLTLRLTGLPWENREEGALLHLGFAFSLRNPEGDTVSFSSRPGTGSGPLLVETMSIAAEEVMLYGFELVFLWHSFTFQAEYMAADLDSPGAGNPMFSGWYAAAGYWITGERRPYDRKSALYKRVSPGRPSPAG